MGSHASPAAAVPGRRITTSARGEACAGSLQGVRMGLTRTAINRPLATVMIFLAFILLGQQAYTKMKVDRFPAITFPVVYVQINWPGATPENIEQAIIVPAENAVSGASGIQRVDANAQQD